MIYLKLFLNFLMIGALSFGGGYGMVSLVRETVISNGWLSESEFLNFIAVSESTPGPLAVNMATFIGSTQGGFLGSFLATLGVVLPSFIYYTFNCGGTQKPDEICRCQRFSLRRPPLRYRNDSRYGNRYGHINIAWFYEYSFGACSGS